MGGQLTNTWKIWREKEKKKKKKKKGGPATLNPENTVEENLNYFFMLLNQHIDMGEVNILLELL